MIQIWAIGGAFALALLLAVCVFLFGGGSRPGFEKGNLLVCVNGGGSVELYWPGADVSSALYRLEFHCGGVNGERYSSRPAAALSGLPAGEELRVRVRAVDDGQSVFGNPRQVESWKSFRAKVVLPDGLEAPAATGVMGDGTAELSWTGDGERYEVFRTYGRFASGTANSVPAASTEEMELSIPLEEDGEQASFRQFTVRAGWKRRGFILCGPASEPVSVFPAASGGWELPEGEQLSLTYQEIAPRMYVLEWNGTRCGQFQVQRWTGEGWETLAHLTPEERMRYDAGRLGSGSYNRFRVAAIDAEGQASRTEEVSFWSSVSTLYSTVWPVQDLTLYENPGKGDRLASIPGGSALCVLEEEGDWFRVRYGEEYGWVDSRFCMINLPEYLGDHCSYDISNSYDSLFAVHGTPIQDVTHQVLPGYENIREEDGTFLVPYLYPCAKKLLAAAQAAQEDSLRLKIYEAFRPRRATRFCYDTAERLLSGPAVAEDGGQTTLYRLMTDNGRFSLGSFLARTVSSHNRGIALDLTLERMDGSGELEMQSGIHDLSWYAATDRDNVNAKLLASYMTGAGMNGLSSEWWHFQDDATRRAIGLNTFLDGGVSAEGWTQDDGGWRYRTSGGSFLRDTTRTIDGRIYAFDGNGYAA